MTETAQSAPGVEHWDAFWRAREKSTRPEEPGARDRAPAAFWAEFFAAEFANRDAPRLIDIACGNGAVIAIANDAAAAAAKSLGVTAVDYSKSALQEVRRRFPQVRGAACDSRRLPFPDRSFPVFPVKQGLSPAF